MDSNTHIGTCSWKYDSWQGIIYPENKPFNYLQEYSKHYQTVEVDQWFWSLFKGNKAVLPKPSVVREYVESVPEGFKFCIKVPNSITLTHHYKKKKSDPLEPNPHFLSVELMKKFLERLEPMSKYTGLLIFQFEYLNKKKVPGGLREFIDRFGEFAEQLSAGHSYFVESRNPNFINENYFNFLQDQGLYNVFLQGYYMPPIFEIYSKHRELIKNKVVIRLHGPDRKGIEEKTGKDWSRVDSPQDRDIESLSEMLLDLESRNVQTFIYVNNYFEGSAPRTIERIQEALGI